MYSQQPGGAVRLHLAGSCRARSGSMPKEGSRKEWRYEQRHGRSAPASAAQHSFDGSAVGSDDPLRTAGLQASRPPRVMLHRSTASSSAAARRAVRLLKSGEECTSTSTRAKRSSTFIVLRVGCVSVPLLEFMIGECYCSASIYRARERE